MHSPVFRTTSWALSRNKAAASALGGPLRYRPARLETGRGAALVGWGRKASGLTAQRLAANRHAAFVILEDGFLRSVGRHDPALSFVRDTAGVYYDATCPSLLEGFAAEPLSPSQVARTQQLVERWRALGVSKYNCDPDYDGGLPARYVLVVDQVAGDASILYGNGGPDAFLDMLACAREENPDCTVVVKVHPDTLRDAAFGHFEMARLQVDPQIMVIAERCHAARLLSRAERIYAVTSQMGFEGLLWGKPVRCFGMPFYAGWGLTDDEVAPPARRHPVTLHQLVHAALVRYPVYLDPRTSRPCEVEVVLEHIGACMPRMIGVGQGLAPGL